MSKHFTGAWATFEYLDDLCSAIKELKQEGFNDLSTHAPCPRHEIEHALHDKQSRVPFFTLIFGALGTMTGYLFASWATVNWVLPVSGKPLVSYPPYTIIGFELTILLGAYGTMFGVVVLILIDTLRKSFPKSLIYKTYNRFTNDRFGLIVRAKREDGDKVESILRKYLAEEVHSES